MADRASAAVAVADGTAAVVDAADVAAVARAWVMAAASLVSTAGAVRRAPVNEAPTEDGSSVSPSQTWNPRSRLRT